MNTDETAFLRTIADAHTPDAALVYADWLDDRGRADDAAFVRDQCRAEALAGRDGEPEYDALLDRIEAEDGRRSQTEAEGLQAIDPVLKDARVEWRRGVLDSLLVAAPWFVSHGAALRERYPSLRRLVVFRLNGWGERLAACPALEGLREVEFPCW